MSWRIENVSRKHICSVELNRATWKLSGTSSTICTSYVPVGELRKCTNYSIIAAIPAIIRSVVLLRFESKRWWKIVPLVLFQGPKLGPVGPVGLLDANPNRPLRCSASFVLLQPIGASLGWGDAHNFMNVTSKATLQLNTEGNSHFRGWMRSMACPGWHIGSSYSSPRQRRHYGPQSYENLLWRHKAGLFNGHLWREAGFDRSDIMGKFNNCVHEVPHRP